MQASNKKASKRSKPGLRMQEMVEATGLPKSTILHYLSQGLLPEPIKTSPNMAYYDARSIDRIRFIRHLQRHHRLSLSEIKQMIEAREEETDFPLHAELDDLIFGPPQREGFVNREVFCEKTGLTDDQLADLLETRLILPLEKDRFDQQDVTIGKMYAQAISWGIQINDLTYYVDLGEKIVDHEMALRHRITAQLPYDEDAVITLEMVKNARMGRAYVIDRLFQHRVASMRDLKDTEEKE